MLKGLLDESASLAGSSRPSGEVENLLMRFGDVESRGDCLWQTLRMENLPRSLQATPLASEACRWVMILSWIGQIVFCFKRGEYELLIPARATA